MDPRQQERDETETRVGGVDPVTLARHYEPPVLGAGRRVAMREAIDARVEQRTRGWVALTLGVASAAVVVAFVWSSAPGEGEQSIAHGGSGPVVTRGAAGVASAGQGRAQIASPVARGAGANDPAATGRGAVAQGDRGAVAQGDPTAIAQGDRGAVAQGRGASIEPWSERDAKYLLRGALDDEDAFLASFRELEMDPTLFTEDYLAIADALAL